MIFWVWFRSGSGFRLAFTEAVSSGRIRSIKEVAMQTITLSESALSLLRSRVARERVEVTDETRPFYRELVACGLMIPLHTMTGGDESAYRLTEAGVTFASHPASSEASLSQAH
jgi:hypothetical protein